MSYTVHCQRCLKSWEIILRTAFTRRGERHQTVNLCDSLSCLDCSTCKRYILNRKFDFLIQVSLGWPRMSHIKSQFIKVAVEAAFSLNCSNLLKVAFLRKILINYSNQIFFFIFIKMSFMSLNSVSEIAREPCSIISSPKIILKTLFWDTLYYTTVMTYLFQKKSEKQFVMGTYVRHHHFLFVLVDMANRNFILIDPMGGEQETRVRHICFRRWQ